MDHISEEELRAVPKEIALKKPVNPNALVYDEKEIVDITKIMNSPLEVQKKEAAILYSYLEQKRKKEIMEKGIITDHTRRIMEGYHELLNNIHKAMFGEKSTNLHLHGGLTPAHISAFISKHRKGDRNGK